MKLREVLPNVNPDGDALICHDVMPLGVNVGMYVLCDRELRDGKPHTGKHQHHSVKGLVQWWGPDERYLRGESP